MVLVCHEANDIFMEVGSTILQYSCRIVAVQGEGRAKVVRQAVRGVAVGAALWKGSWRASL